MTAVPSSTVPDESRITRAILTGEYPPQIGGVSSYTRLVAEGLAAKGERVYVFAPASPGGSAAGAGVDVQSLPGAFGPRALRALSRGLDALPGPRRLLLQYVPHAFGWKAMNLPLCAALAARKEPLDVMFHEAAFPWGPRPGAVALAAVHRVMIATLAPALARVYVSTPAWEPLLRRFGVRREITWLPVPSNLPEHADPASVARVREGLGAEPGACVIGHFGTYGGQVAALLSQALAEIRRALPRCPMLLVGRGSREFQARCQRDHPALAENLRSTGETSDLDAAAHLAACDVLVQPFPDGVTTRRTSLMAGLALGAAVVTNRGALTEPLWQSAGGVELAPVPEGTARLAVMLATDPVRRRELAARGVALYRDRFAVERTISVLHDACLGAVA